MNKGLITLVITVFCLSAGNISAQNQMVRLSGGKEITLAAAFEQIEEQTRFSVDYNESAIDIKRKVSNVKDSVRLDQLLGMLLDDFGLTYEFNRSHIVISRKATGERKAPDKDDLVSGKVTDESGTPLTGASVNVKGTEIWATCGVDGEYTIKARPGDVLVFSFLGFLPKETAVKSSTMNIMMETDRTLLDEVVVVGYGTVFKKKVTSAITTVSAEDIAAVPVPNVTQSLAGRAPGLIVQQSGGGLDVMASLSIRGGGTPLYVIDDIICEERDFQNINPEDIASFSILKDASATAIYGARAANGIVIVTTKQGESGRINVDYNVSYNLSQPANLAKKLDSYTAAYYVNRGLEYDGGTPSYTQEDLELFRNGTDPKNHPNTDWQDVCMSRFAPETRHTLSIKGGTDKIRSYTGLAFNDQNSIYRSDSHYMQRFNLRQKVETSFKEIGLRIISSMDAYMTYMKQPATTSGGGYYYVWSHIQNKKPMEVAKNPIGQIYSGTTDNPLLDISSDGGYVTNKSTSLRATLNAEWSVPWVTGLKVKGIGSYSVYNNRNKSWLKTAPSYDWDGNIATSGKPNLSKYTMNDEYFNTQLLIEYSKVFAERHSLDFTAGIEASGSTYDMLSASRKNFIFDVDQMGAGPSSTMENSSPEGIGERRAAVIGRIRYDYMSKYLFEANARYDGSDYFPSDKRWGLFFSGSAAWAVSEENFWKNSFLSDAIELFKARVSYGEIGLDDVGRYSYMTSYNLNQRGAYINGSWMPVFSEGDLISPDITWYKTKDFNVGLDFASLNNRLSGSVDYFAKVTTGYLASPSNVGYTAPLGKSLPLVKSNGESVRRGFEFILQWKDKIGEFSYNVSTNFSLYDDRWNVNPNESETSLMNPYIRSTQVGAYTGLYYRNLGYYSSYEDIMNSPKRNGSTNLRTGDLKYRDINGDGKIDENDLVRTGDGTKPRTNYGINAELGYKGWFMNMLWQGAGNYNIYMANHLQGGNAAGTLPVIYEFQTDIWSPDNTSSLYPRQHASAGFNGGNNFVGSDFWLVNARYIRLKTLAIGYDFKHQLLKNVSWLSRCALSLSGYNLLTFSPSLNYGFDPETGRGDGFTYPMSRVYTISLNIGF